MRVKNTEAAAWTKVQEAGGDMSLVFGYHQSRLVSTQVGGGALLCHVRLFGLCYFLSFLLKPVSSDLQHQTLTTTSQKLHENERMRNVGT